MEDWKVEELIMKDLIRILREGFHSLVVFRDEIFTYDGKGISDLLRLLNEQPEVLDNASIADKIVGKGAAALMALGKVKDVYADVISESALALLVQEGIRATYGKLVPHIINHAGKGMCPVETRCLPCSTPTECLAEIKAFIEEMKTNKLSKQ